jgi:hypothetical protein
MSTFKKRMTGFRTEVNLININNCNISILYSYVPSLQLQGKLEPQHSVDTGSYIKDKHNIKSETNHRQALEEKHIKAEK